MIFLNVLLEKSDKKSYILSSEFPSKVKLGDFGIVPIRTFNPFNSNGECDILKNSTKKVS